MRASIDGQNLTVDEGGVVRGEEKYAVCDVLIRVYLVEQGDLAGHLLEEGIVLFSA
jgi:hypothetical protein